MQALRKSFLRVDESLNEGGLVEVAQIRKANPPAKSPIMKIFHEVLASKNQIPTPGMEGGPSSDPELDLDSIGCTANVVLVNYDLKKIYVANAGDSRCVMGHGGKCTPLSFDHKPEN